MPTDLTGSGAGYLNANIMRDRFNVPLQTRLRSGGDIKPEDNDVKEAAKHHGYSPEIEVQYQRTLHGQWKVATGQPLKAGERTSMEGMFPVGKERDDSIAAHAEMPTVHDIEAAGGQKENIGGTQEYRFPTTRERETQLAAEVEHPAGAVSPEVRKQYAAIMAPSAAERERMRQEAMQHQDAALQELEPYKIKREPGITAKQLERYHTGKYLYDNPGKEYTLLAAGFEDKDIREAVNWARDEKEHHGRMQYESPRGETIVTAGGVEIPGLAEDIMRPYKAGKGYDLTKAYDEGVSEAVMQEAGFKEKDIKAAVKTVKAAQETGVALAHDERWQNAKTGEVISGTEYRVLKGAEKDNYVLTTARARREAIKTAATWFASPIRVALPEVEAEHIELPEYALGLGQLATWALPTMPKGIVPFVSAGAGGAFAYSYAKNIQEAEERKRLDPSEKGLSPAELIIGGAGILLVSAPALLAAGKSVVPVAVKVATSEAGEVTIWRGLAPGGKPVIGISQGKLAVGTKGIKYPEGVEAGYAPVTKVETSVMGTREALSKMGFTEEEIAKVESTLDTRAMFAGKKSPYLSQEALTQPIKSLSGEGVVAVLKEYKANEPQMTEVYGSYSMKPMLEPVSAKGRIPGDIDIQTKMSQADAEAFAQRLVKSLEKTEGKGNVRISKETPTLIEAKGENGNWRHAVDIHSQEVGPGSEKAPEGAYGMEHYEKPIKVKVPGVGKIEFMTLSETGKRKAGSILQFQDKEIGPATHRVKDIADFYMVVRTLKGEKVADKWAKTWGQDPAKLLKLAEESPPVIRAWRLSPGGVPAKGSPSIVMTVPKSLAASTPASLKREISTPITSKSLATSTKASVAASVASSKALSSPGVSASASAAASKGSISSARISPRASASAVPSPSPYRSVVASPSKSPSPGKSPSPSPSPSKSPSISVSKSPSPSKSPAPSPSPSPSPSPKGTSKSPSPSRSPSPSPAPSPHPSPKTPTPTITGKGEVGKEYEKEYQSFSGAIGWKQGAVIWAIKKPYENKDDVGVFSVKHPPPHMKLKPDAKTAFETIQTMTGKPPDKLRLDMGIMDISVSKPSKEPGKPRAIVYTRDIEQKTTGDISLGRGKPQARIKRPRSTIPKLRRGVSVRILKGNGYSVLTKHRRKGKVVGRESTLVRGGRRKIIRD